MVNLTHCTSQTLRAMLVVVDGEKSRVLPLISGVSQGSALGPLLFLVSINEVRSHQIVLYHSLLMTSPCINASSKSVDYWKLQLDINTWNLSCRGLKSVEEKFDTIIFMKDLDAAF